jgi:hypothetical protein
MMLSAAELLSLLVMLLIYLSSHRVPVIGSSPEARRGLHEARQAAGMVHHGGGKSLEVALAHGERGRATVQQLLFIISYIEHKIQAKYAKRRLTVVADVAVNDAVHLLELTTRPHHCSPSPRHRPNPVADSMRPARPQEWSTMVVVNCSKWHSHDRLPGPGIINAFVTPLSFIVIMLAITDDIYIHPCRYKVARGTCTVENTARSQRAWVRVITRGR